MVEMARFIKPILSASSRPTRAARPARVAARWRRSPARFARAPERRQRDTFVQLMTMSAADFLDQWFETDPLKATMSASGIIGTFQGVRSPGTAYVLLHHYMGEIDGAFRAWGIPRGGTGGVEPGDRRRPRARSGAEIRTEAPVAQHRRARRPGGRRRRSSPARRSRPTPSSRAPTRAYLPRAASSRARSTREFVDDVRRYRFRGSSGKVNLALDGLPDFTCLPGPGEHLRGAICFSPSRRLHGAGLRRRQVRPVLSGGRTST